MAYQTRRYSYDDDSSSAQNLWIIVLVVGAMVGSFVFGRYVLGDRLRRDAAPMRDVAEEPSLGQPAPLGGSAYAQVPTTPLDQDANAVTGTAPEDVSIVSAETEAQLDGQMPAATRQLEQAMTDPPQDREAERLRAERERQQAEAERKKREEEERRRADAERKKKEEEERRRAAAAARPTPPREIPPTAASRPAATGSGERPAPAPADPTPPTAAAANTGSGRLVRVRAGTFNSAEAAAERQRQVRDAGQEAMVLVREVNGDKVFDVQVGAFENRDNAQALANTLRQQGIETSVSD